MEVKIDVEQELFVFNTHIEWINKAGTKFENAGVSGKEVKRTVAIDRFNRVCLSGSHFEQADLDGAYPIKVYLTRI
jgi:uncharacterized protein YjbI with pentapeptide repeats